VTPERILIRKVLANERFVHETSQRRACGILNTDVAPVDDRDAKRRRV
jgi:hypothetical protein